LEGVKDSNVAIGTAVDVFAFGDKTHLVVGIHIVFDQDSLVDLLR
jgi:hypothetical protein